VNLQEIFDKVYLGLKQQNFDKSINVIHGTRTCQYREVHVNNFVAQETAA
jgi:hypothetical protein